VRVREGEGEGEGVRVRVRKVTTNISVFSILLINIIKWHKYKCNDFKEKSVQSDKIYSKVDNKIFCCAMY
jgi:hypothetical protein